MWDLPDLPLALVMEELLEWEKKPGQEKDAERVTGAAAGLTRRRPLFHAVERRAAHLFRSFTASASAFSIASFAAGRNCFSIVLLSGGVSSGK